MIRFTDKDHARIVRLLNAEIARLRDKNKQLCEEWDAWRERCIGLDDKIDKLLMKEAELYKLAESAALAFTSDTDEWVSQMDGLTSAVLNKFRPIP